MIANHTRILTRMNRQPRRLPLRNPPLPSAAIIIASFLLQIILAESERGAVLDEYLALFAAHFLESF